MAFDELMGQYPIKHLGREFQLFIYNKQEAISAQIITNGTFFEINFLEHLRKNYYQQKSIIDIGANIGNHSVFFSEFLKCDKIYCFEPITDNLHLLKANMQNRNCEIFDVALSNKEDIISELFHDEGNSGSFSLEEYNYYQIPSHPVKNHIKLKTLDSFNLDNISMIKIDVEGHELKVLEGAKETIIKNQPIIFIENLYHAFPAYVDLKPDTFNNFFHEIGYMKESTNLCGSYMDLWAPYSNTHI